ncbi:monovalent cation:proton antiporter family protein [uncultured Aquabacterium sp.]|uniref:monovalent cation:proton antiporter family protein n=1 Tax=Aquabacterium sp. TaxID=1872578 RepID=UPI0025E54757|nr:monovalent cation:proton antiporter family protein [uncultured Aquabacterium sp.]
MASTLDLTLLYLFAAVVGVVLCRLVKLPPMLGYLAVGVVIGPNALALAKDSAGVSYLAEFGVVFLMFVIGLEFNLPKLKSMKSLVFGLGLSQVGLTMLATLTGHVALSMALAWLGVEGGLLGWGLSWQSALALGGALAMSSTAIVVKLMAERLELETEHGRRVMGVLLFQDLAVVPLLVLIPSLGDSASELTLTLGMAALKAAGLLAVLLAGGQKVMHWWLDLVARRKSEELFMLNLLLVTLGLAWLTEHFGLSLALGAFVAGMLIAETEYKHQVETDIRPFHDVLLGLFFITIGMKLDWHSLVDQWALVLLLASAPVLFKLGLVTGLARLFGAPTGVALRTGLYLAQAGEFGFVLLNLASEQKLIPHHVQSPLLASMVLSMLATPFIIHYSNWIVMKVSSTDWLMQSLAMTKIASKAINTEKHVVICGYGRSGQNLARLLEQERIPYMALDLDPDRVRQAAAAGQNVVFGDATRLQSLVAAGLTRAAAVVVTYPDTPTARKVLHHVREHAPHVPVAVRTIDDMALDDLQAAGASVVVPEAIEGSLMLASQTLALVGVPIRRVIRLVQDQRVARYGLLRGYFHGADDDSVDELELQRLQSITIEHSSVCVGQTLDASLDQRDVGVTVVSVRRAHGAVLSPAPSLRLEAGDTLVLSGRPQDLARAESLLLKG